MNKFWNFTDTDSGRVLDLNGTIASESWFDDDVTPQLFKDELESKVGDVTVNINSPGGDVFAAAQMYNMLRSHRGKVKVMVDSLAASAASVIAMAGDEVEISPVGMLMIHNPSTVAAGDHNDMQRALDTLNEVKESIINAYQTKTHLSRKELSDLMEHETWMNANMALEKGFVDKISGESSAKSSFFSTKSMDNTVLNKIVAKFEGEKPEPSKEQEKPVTDEGTKASDLMARLDVIKKFI